MNASEKTLKWINDRLEENKTVYLRTAYKTMKINNAVISKWEKSEKKPFKIIRRRFEGCRFFIATPNILLVKVLAD